MKKILIVCAALIALAGCTPSANQYTPNMELPSGLKDCKFY